MMMLVLEENRFEKEGLVEVQKEANSQNSKARWNANQEPWKWGKNRLRVSREGYRVRENEKFQGLHNSFNCDL